MDDEMKEMEARRHDWEKEGQKNILKHFDRIHDKLFTLNTLLIASYIGLSKVIHAVPFIHILVPILNMAFLISIEYRMMSHARMWSNVRSISGADRDKIGKNVNSNNLLSLFSILSIAAVLVKFVLDYL